MFTAILRTVRQGEVIVFTLVNIKTGITLTYDLIGLVKLYPSQCFQIRRFRRTVLCIGNVLEYCPNILGFPSFVPPDSECERT